MEVKWVFLRQQIPGGICTICHPTREKVVVKCLNAANEIMRLPLVFSKEDHQVQVNTKMVLKGKRNQKRQTFRGDLRGGLVF